MRISEVCAVIVTYHIGSRIFDSVHSVIDQVGGVVIVDNGSGDDTLAALHELQSRPRVTVIYNSDNVGIARALNQGVQLAIRQDYRWVLTLDHDSQGTPGMVEKLVTAYHSLGVRIGIVAANPFDRNAQVFQRPDVKLDAGYLFPKTPVISSGSLIGTATFEKVGFFDEPLFLYFVDNEFCYRVWRNGFRIVVCPDAILVHSEGNKVAKRFLWRKIFYDRHGRTARYYIARNSVFMLKRYPHEMGFGSAFARRLGTDLLKVFLYDEQRWLKVAYVLKGLWDGVRGKYGRLELQRGE